MRLLLALFLYSPKATLLFARLGVPFDALKERILQSLKIELTSKAQRELKGELKEALRTADPLDLLDSLVEREGAVRRLLLEFGVTEGATEKASDWVNLGEERLPFPSEPIFEQTAKIALLPLAAAEKKHGVYFSYLSLVEIIEKTSEKDMFVIHRAIALLDRVGAKVRRDRGEGALVLAEDVT